MVPKENKDRSFQEEFYRLQATHNDALKAIEAVIDSYERQKENTDSTIRLQKQLLVLKDRQIELLTNQIEELLKMLVI